MDLYRLGEGGSRGKEAAASSLGRLQLDEAFAGAVSLIEWPERLPAAMVPQRRLELRCVRQRYQQNLDGCVSLLCAAESTRKS